MFYWNDRSEEQAQNGRSPQNEYQVLELHTTSKHRSRQARIWKFSSWPIAAFSQDTKKWANGIVLIDPGRVNSNLASNKTPTNTWSTGPSLYRIVTYCNCNSFFPGDNRLDFADRSLSCSWRAPVTTLANQRNTNISQLCSIFVFQKFAGLPAPLASPANRCVICLRTYSCDPWPTMWWPQVYVGSACVNLYSFR